MALASMVILAGQRLLAGISYRLRRISEAWQGGMHSVRARVHSLVFHKINSIGAVLLGRLARKARCSMVRDRVKTKAQKAGFGYMTDVMEMPELDFRQPVLSQCCISLEWREIGKTRHPKKKRRVAE